MSPLLKRHPDCDRYAASDLDPQRKDVGVPVANLNPVLAIPACESATLQYPNIARLTYQLGRAYYKANNFTAALQQFHKSADQGFAPAQSNGDQIAGRVYKIRNPEGDQEDSCGLGA
jgi:hypothetical protein